MPINNREQEKIAMTERTEHHTFKTDEIPSQEISDPAVLSKTPLVSVVMPTYNHEPYIAQAIEGALMQKTNFPYEVLIGEDDSSDGTREICKRYAEEYPDKIRLFLNDRKNVIYINGQPTGRWNFINLLKNSKGKYIAICEGDDYWTDPYKLQKQVDFLEANPKYVMVHSDGDYHYVKNGKTVKNYIQQRWIKPNEVKNPFVAILRSEYPVITCSVVFRSEMLKSLNLVEMSQFGMGDTFLWLDLAQKGKFYYFNESMAGRHILNESASQSMSYNKLLRFKKSGYELCKHFMNKYETTKETKNIVHEKFNRVILNYSFLAKNKVEANRAWDNLYNNPEIKIDIRDKVCHFGNYNMFTRSIAKLVLLVLKVWKKLFK